MKLQLNCKLKKMKRRASVEEDDSSKRFYFSIKIDTTWTLYNGKFPFFREPKEIGAFSLNSDHKFQDDKSQLKVFIPPSDDKRCFFDLKKGYDRMIQKDESIKSYIDDLLRWTMLHKDRFIVQQVQADNDGPHSSSASQPKHCFHNLNTDFVCWRGLLTRIMCLPYENREDLRIAVIRTRGTYFMCQFDTEAKRRREEQMTERDKQMCAWGWKFEQYVTADKINGRPDTDKPVNNNEEYGVVVRSRLGSHSLVYGAEVDCIDPLDPNGQQYLELKTSRITETQRQNENFCRFKLIKFWAQSFLIGIKRIVCGFRDDNGIVRHLEDFQVKNIPRHASSVIRNVWNPSVCFNFLDSFLSFVKSNIPNDDEKSVYVFYWKPGSQLVLEGKGGDEFYFLPEWFLGWQGWDKDSNLKETT